MKKEILLLVCLLWSCCIFSQDAELELKAKNGECKALYELAYRYANGEKGYPKDSLKAYTLMTKAAEKGDLYAMYDLGFDFVPSTIDNYRIISTKWLETYVQNSKDDMMCSSAELELYFRYLGDDTIKRNITLALKYLKSSVNRGERSDPAAYSVLGECLLEGKYMEKNKEESIKYFKLSAEYGCGLGSTNLGILYYNERKFDLAYKYLKDACEDEFHIWESPKAMLYYSHCYRYGLGGAPKDTEKADYWLNQSATNKERTAMELIRMNR